VSAPAGLGEGWMFQTVPTRSSVRVTVEPSPSVDLPTAMHAPPERHDTAERPLTLDPAGSGVVSVFQFVPSHASAMAVCTPEPVVLLPTATQDRGDVQDTALKKAEVTPGWLGMAMTVQTRPFQSSASADSAPEAAS
jgi:hypothetical protein